MATSAEEKDTLSMMSEHLYELVSQVIGSETVVRIRREYFRSWDVMENCQWTDKISYSSGSRAEGFAMKTSDFDKVYWSKDVVVVEDSTQVLDNLRRCDIKNILSMDCHYTSPGAALVKCIIFDDTNDVIRSTCITKCGDRWVSSRLFREYFLKELPNFQLHGPSQSATMLDSEVDNVESLRCAFWPSQAFPAIERLRTSGWPSDDVIDNMVAEGCLLVAVPSKAPLFDGALEMEWRISFNRAEKCLVHCMNHCQFLCYGLLKLFLSEVIKKLSDVDDELLCSYFMKTIVFWEICSDAVPWTMANFFPKFWKAFGTLIKNVDYENCPNFFIEEHNMFYNRIYGKKREALMSHLRTYYDEGIRCIFRCESLQRHQPDVVNNPDFAITRLVSEYVYLFEHLCKCNPSMNGNEMDTAGQLIRLSRVPHVSEFSSTALSIRERSLTQYMAMRTLYKVIHPHSPLSKMKGNKEKSRFWKFAVNALRLNKTYLGHSELHIANAFMFCGQYGKAIHSALAVKSKIQSPSVMYRWNIHQGLSHQLPLINVTMSPVQDIFRKIIKKSISREVEMYDKTAPTELSLELHDLVRGSSKVGVLHIPPLVLSNFILLLSHHAKSENTERNDVLRELTSLIYDDNSIHVPKNYKAVSWEILGVCQHICGEYQKTYVSFVNALNDRYSQFKGATKARLCALVIVCALGLPLSKPLLGLCYFTLPAEEERQREDYST